MKRGVRAEGDHHSPPRPSNVVKGDKAGSESRACKSGGDGGGWRRRSCNRSPSLSDSSSEDEEGRNRDRFDSSGSDEDEVSSSSRKGKRRGKKVRMSHLKKVVMGRPLPPSMWICAREECLEIAEDIGYVVEALYPMEHVTWTEETELGPERLARTHDFKRKKRKARGSCEDSTPHTRSTSLDNESVKEGCGRENYDAGSGPDLLDAVQSEGSGVVETAGEETGSAAEGERGSRADEVQNEKGAEGLGEQEAKERDEERAKESVEEGENGLDEEGENGADKKGAKAPDEQEAIGPDVQGAKGPAEQGSMAPAEEGAIGPDEMSATRSDEQESMGPTEQRAMRSDEVSAKGADEMSITTSDKQQSMGPAEQAATGPVKGDEIVKQDAELREACDVVLGKNRSSQRAAATTSVNGNDRRYSSDGKTVSGEYSTYSRRDGSSFRVPIIVIDGDEESEERYSAEGATTDGGEDRSMVGDCNAKEGGSENATGGEGIGAGSSVVGICTAPGCGKPSDGSRNGVCARCRASAADGAKRTCAGPGCNRQVTAGKVHGADGSLCSLCSMAVTGGGSAGLERHPEGAHSVNGDAGTGRAGPAGVGGAARPQQLREVVNLASDDEEKVNSSPRPPVGDDRPQGGVDWTRAREGGGERGARNQGTGSPRFVSPIFKKVSGRCGAATTSTGPASLTDFWGAGSGGGSRGGGNSSGTLVEDRRLKVSGGNSMSGARTSEEGDASAGKVNGGGIREERGNEKEMGRRSNNVDLAQNGDGGGNANEANGVCSGRDSDDSTGSSIARPAGKGKRKARRRRKILSDSDSDYDIRGGSGGGGSSGDDDLADSDYDIGVHGSDNDDLTDTGDSEEEDGDDDEVVFQGVQQGRRREGPLDERQEREVRVVCVSVYKHVCNYLGLYFSSKAFTPR